MSRLINRATIVVRPRRPHLDWAAGLGAEAPEHARGLAERVSVYRVAEDPKGEEETAPPEDYYEEIFEPARIETRPRPVRLEKDRISDILFREVIAMPVSQKTYERVKDELSSLKLTLDTLSNRKLMKEIRKGIAQIQKGKWTRVRDDIEV